MSETHIATIDSIEIHQNSDGEYQIHHQHQAKNTAMTVTPGQLRRLAAAIEGHGDGNE